MISANKHRVITILGDYGTGKTTLCRAFAANLASEYLDSPFDTPLPLLIELRTVRHCGRLPDALMEHLRSCGIQDVNPGLVLSLLEEGALVLLLDGLDEFVEQYDLAELTRVLLEFTLHDSSNAKVAVTCRTHYFRSTIDALKAFSPELQDGTSSLVSPVYRELSSRRDYGMVYLDTFTEEMVDEYLIRTLGSTQEQLEQKFPWLSSVRELLSRPILLEMVVHTLPQIRSVQGEVTEYDLYDIYTRMWAKRDAWRRSWAVDARLSFARFLALSLFLENKDHIHYENLLDRLRLFLDDKVPAMEEDLLSIETDARTATFLIRDSEGNYRFAHRSFYEFFLAQHVIEAINNGRGRSLFAKMYPKWLPWNTARFIKNYIDTDKLDLKKLMPSAPVPVKERNIILMIDDSQCREGGILGLLQDHRDRFGGIETTLIGVADSVSGILYAHYLLPLVITHDNLNLIWGPEFVEYYQRHLAPLGILLILHHASFDQKEVDRLLADGVAVAELRKPYDLDDLREVMKRSLEIRDTLTEKKTGAPNKLFQRIAKNRAR